MWEDKEGRKFFSPLWLYNHIKKEVCDIKTLIQTIQTGLNVMEGVEAAGAQRDSEVSDMKEELWRERDELLCVHICIVCVSLNELKLLFKKGN